MGEMKKYLGTQLSGIAWAQEIPNHWNIYRIKHIFKICKRIVGELGYEVLSITQKGIKLKDTSSGAGQLAMDYSKYQLVEVGDFSMNHMDLLTGFVDVSKYHGVISPDYRVFKLINESNDSSFMLYMMQICYIQKIFFGYGKGVSMLGRWRLPAENFRNFKIPVPPKDEQIKIAKFLEYKLAKIDHLIKSKKQLLALFTERRKCVTYQAIISKGSKRFRLGFVAPMIKRSITRIENDLYTPIGLYNRGRGIFHKPLRKGKDLGESTFYKIIARDIILSGQFAWEGAVTIASNNDKGCIASHRFPILKCNTSIIEPEFLYSFFTISEGHFLLDLHSRGSAGRNRPLNARTLLKEKISIPPLELQKSVVDLVNKEFNLRKDIAKEEALLLEYRNRLISDAVSGKINVMDFKIPKKFED